MARIIRILSVIFSSCSCAAMIYFSSQGNNDAVYTCLILCLVGFVVNMFASAHENKLKLEAQVKAEAEQAQNAAEDQMSFEI